MINYFKHCLKPHFPLYIPLYSARELNAFLYDKSNTTKFKTVEIDVLSQNLALDGYDFSQKSRHTEIAIPLHTIDPSLPVLLQELSVSELEPKQKIDMLLSSLDELKQRATYFCSNESVALALLNGERTSLPLQTPVFVHGKPGESNTFSFDPAEDEQKHRPRPK